MLDLHENYPISMRLAPGQVAAGITTFRRRKLARCWSLLLARIYACLPLKCPKCGEPMRIIAFGFDQTPVPRS
jgi:hypothetical protein